MGRFLKVLLFILLALLILVIVVPLLWLLIKEAGGLFGAYIKPEDVGYVIFTVTCVIAIIVMLAK